MENRKTPSTTGMFSGRPSPLTHSNRIGRIDDAWSGRQLSRDFLIVRVADEAALSTAFLYFWLATPAFSAHVERLSRGGAASRISTKDLLSFELPLIERDQQSAVLESLFRVRKELAKFRQTAAGILFWAETLDSSAEHLAASSLRNLVTQLQSKRNIASNGSNGGAFSAIRSP